MRRRLRYLGADLEADVRLGSATLTLTGIVSQIFEILADRYGESSASC